MDTRERRTRERLYEQEQVSVRYRLDSNAALQPDTVPSRPRPERREQPRVKPDLRVVPGGQEKHKRFKRFLGVTLTLAFAASACLLLMGNAAIYENNRNIQKMGKEIQNSIVAVNSAKKELSETAVMERYLALAEELGMQYPEASQIIQLELEPVQAEYEELTAVQENGGLFDKLLDWLNSLERRN